MFELSDFTIVQILLFSVFGASARVIWEGLEHFSVKLYLQKVSMPVVLTLGIILIGEGRIPYLHFRNKYEVWGFSLLFSFFGNELFTRVKDFLDNRFGNVGGAEATNETNADKETDNDQEKTKKQDTGGT